MTEKLVKGKAIVKIIEKKKIVRPVKRSGNLSGGGVPDPNLTDN